MVRETDCSSRRLCLNSQHPLGSSQLTNHLAPGVIRKGRWIQGESKQEPARILWRWSEIKVISYYLWICSMTTLQKLRQLVTRGSKHASPSEFGGAEAGKEKAQLQVLVSEAFTHAQQIRSIASLNIQGSQRSEAKVQFEAFNLKAAGVPSKFCASKGSGETSITPYPPVPISQDNLCDLS